MNYTNYIKIDTDKIKYNLKYLKNNYSYDNYIMDVSNNAFNHGMNIINYLENEINYLYTNNINDIFLIRKYNKDIKVILNYTYDQDNILDIINNNITIIINSPKELELLTKLDLYAPLNIILNINFKGLSLYNDKFIIKDSLDIISNHKKLNLVGIISQVEESNYNDFLYITTDLFNLNLELYILNNENDKNKIKNSNAIKLDNSIYGVHQTKNKLFSKNPKIYKESLNLYSKIIKITTGKKDKNQGLIPFGYLHGMTSLISKVCIKNNLYKILDVKDEYTIIEIDNSININDEVEILGTNNPLDNYFSNETIIYFNTFNLNLPIIYVNEKNEQN